MNPIRTVVAPTDLSALARHAVVRACLLAAELGARLSLQHVVNAVFCTELDAVQVK